MAAANAYRLKTATFSAVAILGCTDFSIKDGGSASDLSTDASPTITAIFVDQIATEVTISSTDVARASAAHAGDTGNLVLIFQLRAEGKGAGAGDKTATMATATLIDVAYKAGTNGIGSVEYTFRCSGPAGTTPIVWS